MMEAFVKMFAGEKKSGSSGEHLQRCGPYSELVVLQGLPDYAELTRTGRLFTSTVKQVTHAATHGSPIAANTATPLVGFLNISTNRVAMLLRAAFSSSSGTPPAPSGGHVILNVIPNAGAIITAAATGNIYNHLLTADPSPQGSKMRPLNNVALTGWVSTLATYEHMLLFSTTGVALAGSSGPAVCAEDLKGQIWVPPGALVAMMVGGGVGTSWVISGSLTWAELDWPL